jgi:hypothetical protein
MLTYKFSELTSNFFDSNCATRRKEERGASPTRPVEECCLVCGGDNAGACDHEHLSHLKVARPARQQQGRIDLWILDTSATWQLGEKVNTIYLYVHLKHTRKVRIRILHILMQGITFCVCAMQMFCIFSSIFL